MTMLCFIFRPTSSAIMSQRNREYGNFTDDERIRILDAFLLAKNEQAPHGEKERAFYARVMNQLAAVGSPLAVRRWTQIRDQMGTIVKAARRRADWDAHRVVGSTGQPEWKQLSESGQRQAARGVGERPACTWMRLSVLDRAVEVIGELASINARTIAQMGNGLELEVQVDEAGVFSAMLEDAAALANTNGNYHTPVPPPQQYDFCFCLNTNS
jgi:hypothetical protein